MKEWIGKNDHVWLHRLNKARFLATAYWRGLNEKSAFEDVETYCMFIGYPRSGHSLIGFLLDAHPEMIIAHELDAFYYLNKLRVSKVHLYGLLLERSRLFSEEYGAKWWGYSYHVPHQWQGRFKKLRVIGDKKGDSSIFHFRNKAESLSRLRCTVKTKVKFIHVVRNPYDNIATISARQKMDLEEAIDYYFYLCAGVADFKCQIDDDDLFEMRSESFVDQPRANLAALCSFLGVECSDDYLNDCASIVFKSPNKTRNRVEWNPAFIDRVKAQIDQFSFLSGYTYEDVDCNRSV